MSTLESDVAREIVSIGLSKAADSMSYFIKDKVVVEEFKIEDDLKGFINWTGDNYTVLTTSLMGELEGVCHLVMTKAEAGKLVDTVLPNEIKDDHEKFKVMSGATLLQADNIISASMITQFSNLLGYQIYGDVPKIKELSGEETNEFLKSTIKPGFCAMYFNAVFGTDQEGFNPTFIWLVSCDFLDGVKEFVKSDENLRKLKQLTA